MVALGNRLQRRNLWNADECYGDFGDVQLPGERPEPGGSDIESDIGSGCDEKRNGGDYGDDRGGRKHRANIGDTERNENKELHRDGEQRFAEQGSKLDT